MAGGWAADARGSAARNHFSATRRAIRSGRQDQSRSVEKLVCRPITDPVGSNNASVTPDHRTFNANEITVEDGRPDEAQILQAEAWTRTTETSRMRAAASRPGRAGDLTLRLRS